ncbi:ABC transporter permease [Neptunomonas antarctica]|uniref:Putative ABC transport system permease protein n=1 Tax=Neptunomonas antarctica TaxID=619304 RepID=A0A1N7K7A0_9GAMM|nr:ABC transporter permease [Neptunomonas antarctica]SIS57483.1 putative ABC transport system permease protein [Neptunomonas antarctica]
MKALDKKLWRELWGMRMQALAIAMVIVGGVSIFIMSLSTVDSLFETREAYYRNNHFANLFASLKRAPLSLTKRIEEIPGVERVDHRVIAYVNIDVAGFDDPVSAHLISLPDSSSGLLNQIYLRSGRLLEHDSDNEILLSEEFARAHKLHSGSKLSATINGRRKSLTVVGHALSPEYIYQIAPGAMFPDFMRYGIVWMARKPLASAYDMEGAFNNVTLTLSKGSNQQDVIDQLDELLKPYGGTGAFGRKDQLSHRFLSEELKQQKTIATVFPIIFFGVAAFILNVVTSRLISLEREQIAVLKAFGYSNFAVGWHYGKLVLMIVSIGVIAGIGIGTWMGKGMSNIYMEFYSLPFMIYVLKPQVVIAAALISITVAILGTLYALRTAAVLPPAQGMRPEPPAIYRPILIERLGLQDWFSQPTRMIIRHIERRPLKSFLTTLGISMACGTMMVGGFQEGAINHMVEVQFGMSQRSDLTAIYTEPTSQRSLYSLRNLQGVEQVEGFRAVPAKLMFEHRFYRTSVQGIQPNGDLLRLLDTRLAPIDLPEQGVIITDYLAELLHIKPGDMLSIQVLEGNRPTVQVLVAGTAKEYMGVNVYMQREALNRLLKEGNAVSGAWLKVDPYYQKDVYVALKNMPRIAGVIEQRSAIKSFYDTMAETILFFTFISTLLGSSIAFGVIYNSMRIALSERNRELASLRVLGFRRSEVAYILLGELGLLTLLAIPLGLLIGYGLCAYLAFQFDSDLYRIPLVLDRDVFAFAALVVIVSALISAVMIWRNLAHLDMVAVLKSKE